MPRDGRTDPGPGSGARSGADLRLHLTDFIVVDDAYKSVDDVTSFVAGVPADFEVRTAEILQSIYSDSQLGVTRDRVRTSTISRVVPSRLLGQCPNGPVVVSKRSKTADPEHTGAEIGLACV